MFRFLLLLNDGNNANESCCDGTTSIASYFFMDANKTRKEGFVFLFLFKTNLFSIFKKESDLGCEKEKKENKKEKRKEVEHLTTPTATTTAML